MKTQKAHLICFETTNAIKGIAILIVVLGHYARFKESPFPIASHMAYFGAAVFAFLSGYGAIASYKDKGIGTWGGYFAGRLERVYLPFVITNIIAIPVYGMNGNNVVARVLLGIDDSIMWYPIFIMCFYFIFAAIYGSSVSEKVKLAYMVIVSTVAYIVMVVSHIPSQWYTCIIPLLSGIFMADAEENLMRIKKHIYRLILLTVLILGISTILTQRTSGFIKYLITGLSGAALSIILFMGSSVVENRVPEKIKRATALIGAYAYWCYLVHMKIFTSIERTTGTTGLFPFVLFVIATILTTVIFGLGWKAVRRNRKNGGFYMNKLRVLHFELDGQLGGIEMFLSNVMSVIDREQIQFEFVTSADHPALEEKFLKMGGIIHHIPSEKNPVGYLKAIRALVNDDYDVIHFHKNSVANIIPIIEAKKAGKRVTVHSHNTLPSKGKVTYYLHKMNQKKVCELADVRLACSTEAGKWMFEEHDFKVITNGIRTEEFLFDDKKRENTRRELKIPNNSVVLGNVGRFTEQKNHIRLVSIFEEYHKINIDSALLLVGDGSLRSEIEQIVRDRGLEGAVIFTGVRNDIPELLMAMDVFVMPSLYEGLPIVGIEAQATGVKMALSDTISTETDICGDALWFSLNTTDGNIAENINTVKSKNAKQRKLNNSFVKKNGFNITATASNLYEIYKLINQTPN